MFVGLDALLLEAMTCGEVANAVGGALRAEERTVLREWGESGQVGKMVELTACDTETQLSLTMQIESFLSLGEVLCVVLSCAT